LTSNINRNLKNQVSWQKRLQYNFDNFMSKGGLSVFLALLSLFLGTFVVMTIVRYISEWFFPNTDIEISSDLYWEVFVQLIGLRDTGDNANFATKIIGVITIFIGLVLFSSLVAFITQEFESRLQILRQGQSPVIEENHTLILGFTDRIIDIIKELVVGNESEADAVVVILSQTNKEEMDNFLRNNLGELKTTRVVTRNGLISNLNDLNKVGIKVAKSVIILNDAKTSDSDELKTLADARVVKAVLAVVAANEEDSLPSIVVELHSLQYRRLAENLAPGAVTTLNEADILARILVQTSRSVGLATVYLNLVGFEGNEFYFYRPEKGWQSLNFGELPFHFSNGIPIGVRHANATLTIKPNKNYQLVEGDEVIVLAEDDSTVQFYPHSVVRPKNFNYNDCCKTLEQKPERHLIIGWNSKTPITLREYAKYLIYGSEVNLVVQDLTSQVKAEFDTIAESYSHIKMDALQVNLDSVEQLVTLKPYEYNSISILAGRGENSEEIDAKTLTILLELRQIFREYTAQTKNQVTTELIAEIIDSQDTDLVIKAGVKDFLLTNQFVSKILAQVSQEPSVMSIYDDLFSVDGSELYIKPISLYFSSKQLGRLTFADCIKAAQERDELCLGVKISALAQNKNKNFGIDLVPDLGKPLNLTVHDALITLAENET
jgi:ion channel POLLUX/CASTOR